MSIQVMKSTDKYGKFLYVLNVDLSHEEEILRAFQWAEENIGGVDVLVNSAGIGGTSTLLGKYTYFFKFLYLVLLPQNNFFYSNSKLFNPKYAFSFAKEIKKVPTSSLYLSTNRDKSYY